MQQGKYSDLMRPVQLFLSRIIVVDLSTVGYGDIIGE